LRLISKSAERNHIIIGGPGTEKSIIDGLLAKGFVVT
jgi:hypothetical protein